MHAAITVSFQQPSYTVSEGAGSVEVCLIIDSGEVEPSIGLQVDVSPLSVTATGGELIWAMCFGWFTPAVFSFNSDSMSHRGRRNRNSSVRMLSKVYDKLIMLVQEGMSFMYTSHM